MTRHFADARPQGRITAEELDAHLDAIAQQSFTDCNRILLIPPDISRLNSYAGDIVARLYGKLRDSIEIDVMPALGTHIPMDESQCAEMFGPDVPFDRILAHRWRDDLKPLGELPAEFIGELSDGRFAEPMSIAVNKRLIEGGYDHILSIGQVVPHEVIGMANYTKNILIGVGGGDTIHKSHFLGAVCGMESIMGRADTPVRRALNTGFGRFVKPAAPPISFLFTVIATRDDVPEVCGLFYGDDDATFTEAAALSQQVNITLCDEPIERCVVFLDPKEFTTTWLGDKAIYRTRMAIADGGELIILAPALQRFGEDLEIDALIRKHGYRGTQDTLAAVAGDPELRANLSAAAHLIHGTADGRFKVTYCTGGRITHGEVESVGYAHQSMEEASRRYDVGRLTTGWHEDADGQRFYYIHNPALGLWSTRDRFEARSSDR